MSHGMKNYKYTSKLRLWVEFCNDFSFVVNDIDIYKVNLGSFRNLIFLVENPLKMCFKNLLSNEFILNFYFWKKKPFP
jgi:hypothetical protein